MLPSSITTKTVTVGSTDSATLERKGARLYQYKPATIVTPDSCELSVKRGVPKVPGKAPSMTMFQFVENDFTAGTMASDNRVNTRRVTINMATDRVLDAAELEALRAYVGELYSLLGQTAFTTPLLRGDE